MMSKLHGFTVVELMVAVAIIAIIGSIALPAFRDMVASNRLLTNANAVLSSFHQARSEALRRSRDVSITACKPGCGSSGTPDWANGWQTIVAGTVIAEHNPLAGSLTATAHEEAPFATTYTYSPQGRLSITATNEIMICDTNRSGEAGRLVTLEPIGHVTVSTITCN